ncbi:type IV secretion system protein VirB4 [Roseomonas chloroacetimidivorans]|uniref:VirB4 family type IV secretion/conjugal transfer ATPase n=1 Tax=Roseomonas chloroacetimidivorans TaxID=1766656 RepID=UPI003C73685D
MRNPFLSLSGWSERGADDYVPFVGHVRDDAVLRTDGSVMGMLRLVGAPFALEEHARRNSRHRFRNAVLRNIADDTLTVVETMVRHDGVAPLPAGSYRSAFAADLENAYRREVLDGWERVNEWFVSVIVTPRAPVTRGLNTLRSRLGRRKEAAATTASDELIRTLDDRMLVLAKAYAEMGPVRLGVREAGGVLFSEIGEALRLFLTARFLPVPMVSGSLGGSIYTDRVICGRRGFEVRTPGRPSFGTLLGFKEYPDRTRPGMLNDLLSADCRVVLTNSFRFHSRAAATGSLARKQAQMANAGDRALSQIDALHDAMDDVASNQATMGSHHVSVALHCDSLPELERRTGEVRAALTNAGASVAVEDLGTEAAYWAQLPGNAAWRTRPGDISSRNFVGFSSLDGYPRGGPSPEWGAPLMRLLTSANTGFDLSLHVGGLPHMAIFGPSGSGKTVFLGMLVAALERVTGPTGTVVMFDKDNANEILVRAMGGRYLTLRAGEDSGLVPMRALPNTPDARVWLLRFVVGLIRADDGPQPDAIELRRLSKAIAFQMRMPPHLRSIAGLCAWLVGEGAGSAGKRLERWGRDGDLGWAFDGEADAFDPDAGLVGVDFSALMEDETVRGPAASYLLHRVRSVIDGRRFVLAADEFWAYLPDERFAKAFEDFALTLRKGNGALIIATQQPQQVLRHPIGATLVSNMPTKVLFPNQSASRSAYCDVGDGSESLHCTPGEYRAVTEDIAAGPRSMLIKRDAGSVVCRVELPPAMGAHLAVLSGKVGTVRLLRKIRRELGTDEPSALLPEFHRRLLEAAT